MPTLTCNIWYLVPRPPSFGAQSPSHWTKREVPISSFLDFLPSLVTTFSHVWMWELDYKESWVPKDRCFWTVVLENTLDSPLDCKEIQPVHPKGDQSWVFIGRTDAEAETPILWPPDAKSWLIGKDPDAGRDWGQVKKGMTGWDGWMASPTGWTWAWVNSGSWWSTGWPGMLRFMGSQSQTWLSNWTECEVGGKGEDQRIWNFCYSR